MRPPNLFILGPSKTGSSSLFKFLAGSKDICVPKTQKEVMFFNRDIYSRGIDWLIQNHYDYFGPKEKYILDASTINLLIPYVPKRILQHQGDELFKFIILYREPWDRMFSHWDMIRNYRPGREHESFVDALKENLNTFDTEKFKLEGDYMRQVDYKGGCYERYYIEACLYYTQAMRYKRIFGQENILCLSSSHLHTELTKNALERFLNIDLSRCQMGSWRKGSYGKVVKQNWFNVFEQYHSRDYMQIDRLVKDESEMFLENFPLENNPCLKYHIS